MGRVWEGSVPLAHLPARTDARQNRLLALLPEADLERVQRHLEPVFLTAGEALYEPGRILDSAYLPVTAIVSLECEMADGKSAEVAIVGSDGIVGIALFMGGESRPNRAVVQASGWAYRLRRHHLHEEFARGGALQHVLLLYTQALLTLTAQTVICNRHHTIDQQLCRWLLLSVDRSPSSVLAATHEHIANMLGVRRESVTEAAGNLQRLGLVHNSRGHVTVLDHAGLESRSCECYRVVKREYDRLLPATPSDKPGS
jgi:CRP-like cAMP-binding protein